MLQSGATISRSAGTCESAARICADTSSALSTASVSTLIKPRRPVFDGRAPRIAALRRGYAASSGSPSKRQISGARTRGGPFENRRSRSISQSGGGQLPTTEVISGTRPIVHAAISSPAQGFMNYAKKRLCIRSELKPGQKPTDPARAQARETPSARRQWHKAHTVIRFRSQRSMR